MGGILHSVARLSLLSGIFDMAAALLDLVGVTGFAIPSALVALVVRWHGRRRLGHGWLRSLL
jgi:hypothetical protein